MTLTKNAIGNLINRYKAVLAKCRLLNTLGTLAVASMLVLGGAGMVEAADSGIHWYSYDGHDWSNDPSKSSWDHWAGNYGENADVTGGDVTIDTGNGKEINGGVSNANGVRTTNNSVLMKSGTVSWLYGGYSLQGNAENNRVTMTGGTVKDGVMAGYAGGSGNVYGNTVEITNATVNVNDSVWGGFSSNGKADGNKVIISGGIFSKAIYGGESRNRGTNATGNTVKISGGTFSGKISGGEARGDAIDNTVTIEDGTFKNAIYGGSARANGNGAGSATGNTLTISGGNFTGAGAIYGGATLNDGFGVGNTTGNTVTISGTIDNPITVDANVYGGKTDGGEHATNNTVILRNATVKDVFGGDGGSNDNYSNNRLRVEGKNNQAVNIESFQNYDFVIPATFDPNTDTLLHVTGSVDFGADAKASIAGLAGNTSVGAKFTLIQIDGRIDGNITVTDLDTDDAIYKYTLDFLGGNLLEVTLADVILRGSDFGSQLSGELGSMFNAAFASGEVKPSFANDYTKPAGVRFLARAINKDYGNGSTEAAKAVESVAQAAAIAAVPQMTMGANLAGVSAIGQRTTISQPTSSLQSVAVDNASGINSGDDIAGLSAGNGYDKNGFAMWIMPLWQSNNSFGMESGNYEMDSHSSIGGIAIGADYTIEQAIRLGLTFNIGGGYAEGSGDLAKTRNNMNFWGVGAYAGWAYNNFGLTADVNYTSTHNNIKQEVDPSFRIQNMEADVMASAISAGLRAEYKFNTDALEIIPHVGVRYIHLTTYGYDVENAGETVLEANTTSQNIWTFPIGVQFAKSFNLDNGWYVRPSLDLNVTPAAGDINVKPEVRFTGVTASASPETQTIDWITYGGQAGLEFGNDNLKLGLNYNLQAGAHTTNHGVFCTLRYEF